MLESLFNYNLLLSIFFFKYSNCEQNILRRWRIFRLNASLYELSDAEVSGPHEIQLIWPNFFCFEERHSHVPFRFIVMHSD